jgi:hypothetical protein
VLPKLRSAPTASTGKYPTRPGTPRQKTWSGAGFARDPGSVRALVGDVTALWGFVEHGNLYGNGDAQRVLGEYWSGPGPGPQTWQFGLKARAEDPVGHSFPVRVPVDLLQDDILRVFAADARAGPATRV